MRTIIIFAFTSILLSNSSAFSQILVSADGSRRVYLGIDNPISVVMNNQSCDKIKVEVSQGIIKREGQCSYSYRPDSLGSVVFKVSKIGNEKLNASFHYVVYNTPDLNVRLGKYGSGQITKQELLQQEKLNYRVLPEIIVCGVPINIDTFNFAILRDTTIIFYEKNSINKISPTEKEAINNAQTGDKIIIFNINAYIDNKKYYLNPLEFTLVE